MCHSDQYGQVTHGRDGREQVGIGAVQSASRLTPRLLNTVDRGGAFVRMGHAIVPCCCHGLWIVVHFGSGGLAAWGSGRPLRPKKNRNMSHRGGSTGAPTEMELELQLTAVGLRPTAEGLVP